jgi:hypothetical protein
MSPSKIDIFYQFKNNEYEWYFGPHAHGEKWTDELFIKKVLGIGAKYGYQVHAGTAIHKAIEKHNLLKGKIGTQTTPINEWEIKLCIDPININIPNEDTEKFIKGIIGGILINGKYDAKDHEKIHDIKTTSKIDLDSYKNSYQWKMYLVMTGLKRFVYDIFQVRFDEKKPYEKDANGHKILNRKLVEIVNYERLELDFYNGLDVECHQFVAEFNDYLISNLNLIKDIARQNNVQIKGL